MSDLSGYTYERGHIRRLPDRRPRVFRIKCAFCRGTGEDPGSILNDDCPACNGTGYFNLEGSPEDYSRCGRCGGTGRSQNIISIDPCHICGGSGLV
jgi:DnaJ-class molecular chaperone